MNNMLPMSRVARFLANIRYGLLLLFCLVHYMPAIAGPGDAASQAKAQSFQAKAPLLFTENRGQIRDDKGMPRADILFAAHGNTTKLFFTASGIYYQFTQMVYPAGYNPAVKTKPGLPGKEDKEQARLEKLIQKQSYRFSLELAGANPHPAIRREEKSSYTENYYQPNDEDGITNIASYSRLVYEEVYPHIDWVIYSNGNGLKYDFVVRPGGDPNQIRLNIKDAQQVSITSRGELLMKTSLGEVREQAPVSYADGKPVKTAFRRNADGTIGFAVVTPIGAVLRIDPSVTWATYYGGSGTEQGSLACSTDVAGNVYMVGITNSANNMATAGAFQSVLASGSSTLYDAYLVKFDATGNRLWATYYGGLGNGMYGGRFQFMSIDPSGSIYIAGAASVSGFATTGSYQPILAGDVDAFLAKFNASGTRLWATYYGGPLAETLFGCSTDAVGNVFLCGSTLSTTGIATTGAYQTGLYPATPATTDAYLVKFDGSGNRLWSTYFGGSGTESGYSCANDAAGNVYMAGPTTSSNNIFFNGFQSTTGQGYLVKFNAAGSRQWCTYYGYAYACTVDASNNVYLAGAGATGVASTGAFQTTGNGSDAYLAKFNPSGNRLWGTYYGGSGLEQSFSIATNANRDVYLGGVTTSANIMGYNGFQNTLNGTADAFLAKFDSTGTRQWGSYFGGSGTDAGSVCTVDPSGYIYFSGNTNSTSGIATAGAFQTTNGGGTYDAFLTKIADVRIVTDSIAGSPFCAGTAVNVPFHVSGTVISAGNVFTAQLSDATGSFASPVNIGSLTGTTSGTIAATIPIGTPAGTGYRIRVISSNPAAIGSDNGSNLVINSSVVPVVTITSAPVSPICAGTSVTFTATPVNGGTAPTYQWVVNTTTVGTNSPNYTTNTLTNNDAVYAVMTSNAACPVPTSDTSNVITMTVNPSLTPTVSIAANPGTTICAGASVTFTPTITNGGTSTVYNYDWRKNGTTVGTAATYTSTTLVNGDVITLLITGTTACVAPASSNALTITVNPIVNPAVAITANPGATICAGTTVTFTATPSNGPTSVVPAYQWKKNGINVGTNSTTYMDNSLSNNDVISVVMTSNAPCATAPTANASVTMTVNPVVTPTVTIHANAGDTICIGTGVTFIATPVNGGTAPAYQWYLNGVAVPGSINSTYYNSGLSTGNTISVVMTGNAQCAATNIANSNIITMTVLQITTPSVSITSDISPYDTICSGSLVSFTATPVNGGSLPVYHWKKNGIDVGGNTAIYNDSTLSNNDCISVVLNGSLACTPVNNAVSSNTICWHIKKCCPMPVNLAVDSYTNSNVVFSWTGVADAVGYEFTSTTDGSNPPSGTFTTGTTATISSIITSQTYYLYVRTRCTNGGYSPWTKISLSPLGVGTNPNPGDDFSIYLSPNPATDDATVTVKNGKGKMHISIIDMAGRGIYAVTTPLQQVKLNLQELPSGIYMLHYNDEVHRGYIKLNKQ